MILEDCCLFLCRSLRWRPVSFLNDLFIDAIARIMLPSLLYGHLRVENRKLLQHRRARRCQLRSPHEGDPILSSFHVPVVISDEFYRHLYHRIESMVGPFPLFTSALRSRDQNAGDTGGCQRQDKETCWTDP